MLLILKSEKDGLKIKSYKKLSYYVEKQNLHQRLVIAKTL